jgi:hypothetical protein
MKLLKSIVVSWDSAIAAVVAIVAYALLSDLIDNEFARDVYNIGISVLSIVFSVYFAALAIIISSSDDDFVHYLVKNGHYTLIINAFLWTLFSLFIALIYSIVLYVITASLISTKLVEQYKLPFVIFCALFAYSLLAAFFATKDALRYSEFRAKFVERNKNDPGSR